MEGRRDVTTLRWVRTGKNLPALIVAAGISIVTGMTAIAVEVAYIATAIAAIEA